MGSKLHGFVDIRRQPAGLISIDPLSDDDHLRRAPVSSEFFVCDRQSIFHEAPGAQTGEGAGNPNAHNVQRKRKRRKKQRQVAATLNQPEPLDMNDVNTMKTAPHQPPVDHLENDIKPSTTRINDNDNFSLKNIVYFTAYSMMVVIVFISTMIHQLFGALHRLYPTLMSDLNNEFPNVASFSRFVYCIVCGVMRSAGGLLQGITNVVNGLSQIWWNGFKLFLYTYPPYKIAMFLGIPNDINIIINVLYYVVYYGVWYASYIVLYITAAVVWGIIYAAIIILWIIMQLCYIYSI